MRRPARARSATIAAGRCRCGCACPRNPRPNCAAARRSRTAGAAARRVHAGLDRDWTPSSMYVGRTPKSTRLRKETERRRVSQRSSRLANRQVAIGHQRFSAIPFSLRWCRDDPEATRRPYRRAVRSSRVTPAVSHGIASRNATSSSTSEIVAVREIDASKRRHAGEIHQRVRRNGRVDLHAADALFGEPPRVIPGERALRRNDVEDRIVVHDFAPGLRGGGVPGQLFDAGPQRVPRIEAYFFAMASCASRSRGVSAPGSDALLHPLRSSLA